MRGPSRQRGWPHIQVHIFHREARRAFAQRLTALTGSPYRVSYVNWFSEFMVPYIGKGGLILWGCHIAVMRPQASGIIGALRGLMSPKWVMISLRFFRRTARSRGDSQFVRVPVRLFSPFYPMTPMSRGNPQVVRFHYLSGDLCVLFLRSGIVSLGAFCGNRMGFLGSQQPPLRINYAKRTECMI